jgi:tetraacyldisaccharide 4'-kinase
VIGLVTSLRRSLHDRGLLSSSALPRPVVSVGNVAVGGTGKTPHVAWLARELVAAGLRPCILSRGYGREGRGVVVVSDGSKVIADARRGGDEPVLLGRLLPGVPVVVGESRKEAGEAFLKEGDADLFLLDDGFQHLSLARSADLVLVDCRKGLGNGLSLPFGPLREGPASLLRADGVVVTKCPSLDAGLERGATLTVRGGVPVGYTSLSPTRLVDGDWKALPLPAAGWEVDAFSALADNGQFRRTLEGLGWKVARFRPFRDHFRFPAGTVDAIRREAGGRPVVTTMKDLVRLPGDEREGILALDVEVEPLAGMEGVVRMATMAVEKWREGGA